MTNSDLRDFLEHTDRLRAALSRADQAVTKYYHAHATPRASDFVGMHGLSAAGQLELLRDLALQAADINEGGGLRMSLVEMTVHDAP